MGKAAALLLAVAFFACRLGAEESRGPAVIESASVRVVVKAVAHDVATRQFFARSGEGLAGSGWPGVGGRAGCPLPASNPQLTAHFKQPHMHPSLRSHRGLAKTHSEILEATPFSLDLGLILGGGWRPQGKDGGDYD